LSLPPDLVEELRPFLEAAADAAEGPSAAAWLEALRNALLGPEQDLPALTAAAVVLAQAAALAAHVAAHPGNGALARAALAWSARAGVEVGAAGRLLAAVARDLGADVVEDAPAPPRPRRRPVVRRRLRAAAAFLVGAAAIPAAVFLSRGGNPSWTVGRAGEAGARAPAALGEQLRDGYRNIWRADYVGPAVCGECHEEKHAAWRAHPHSRMNQDAGPGTVVGDFSGARVVYGTITAVFDRLDGAYRMTLREDGALLRRYRVTRTVGSRLTQMYVGVQTEGPEPAGHHTYATEGKLPFGYWTARGRWMPVNYFDSDHTPDYDDDSSNARAVRQLTSLHRWEASCIFCHNTYPYAARLATGRAMTTGFPPGDLRLEPPPGGSERRTLAAAELVTLGISCESCHFGGREHVESEAAPRFLPSAPGLRFPAATEALVDGARDSAYVVNSICGQCHAAQVSLYPDRSATWNSREQPDLLSGACAPAIQCTDCHDPHEASPPGGGPDDPRHVEACLSCHPALRDASARVAHTRHDAGVSCLDCHMPRVVQGLDAVVRTHRIGSPTDRRMLAQAAPNACNLCHLDRSIEWTAAALGAWGVAIAPDPGWATAYGGRLDRPVGEAWLDHEVPIARLVGADAYGRSPAGRAALPRLLGALADPIPVNRVFVQFAVERLLGRAGPRSPGPMAPPAPPGHTKTKGPSVNNSVVSLAAAGCVARRARSAATLSLLAPCQRRRCRRETTDLFPSAP